MPPRKPWFDLHDETNESPRVAILGLPFDGATSLKKGAAAAPQRLREISRTCDPINRRGRRIAGLSLRDYGDVGAAHPDGRPLAQAEYFAAASSTVAAIPADSLLITLGGDNSVSIPVLTQFLKRHGPDAGILWFDAHPDLFPSYDGNADSHACALRRPLTLTGTSPGRAVLLATRSFSSGERDLIDREAITLVTAAEWLASGPEVTAKRIVRALGSAPAVYLAIDVDGFDASVAPGTGYPTPGGPSSEAFFCLLEALLPRLPIRAIDLTEIAPPLDVNDVTSFLGVQVVLEILAIVAAREAPAPSIE